MEPTFVSYLDKKILDKLYKEMMSNPRKYAQYLTVKDNQLIIKLTARISDK